MRKIYEIFKVLKIQKSIVSAKTIRGKTVIWFECLTRNSSSERIFPQKTKAEHKL